jgi:integrase
VDLSRQRIWLPAEFVKSKEDQWVPLDPELRAALEVLPRRGRKVFHFVKSNGAPLAIRSVSQRVIRLAARAGVKLTMKALRRGFACCYASKVSAQVLQKLMRHADIKTTLAFYANVDDAVERAVLGDSGNSPASRNSLRNSDLPQEPAPAAALERKPLEGNGVDTHGLN